MKILFLSAAKSIHTVKWVNAFAERGHEVYLISIKGHEPKENTLHSNIKFYQLRYGGTLGYYMNAHEFSKLVKKIKPDVINVHYASGYGTLARISNISHYILSIWGSDVYDFPYESRLKNYILKKNVKKAEMLASTSECMANQLRKVMGNEKLEIAITPFGVDLNLFDPSKYPKDDNDDFVVGTVKALESKYGIYELILAFDKLKKHLEEKDNWKKNLKLIIYGDGTQKVFLEKIIKEKKLEKNVLLKGRIPNSEVPKAISKFDLFVVLSQLDSESFGVAAVEAMAMEKPVIASDVDGFKEVIKDEITGVIVPRKGIDIAEETMYKFTIDSELRNRIGVNGRIHVEKKYSWMKNVDNMLEIYNKMNEVKVNG